MPTTTPLSGCIPILCTPFTEEGALDPPSLVREIEWVLAEGARGVACLAIASEGYKLTEGERDDIVRIVVAAVAGRVPVIASADGAGVEPAIDRAGRAVALGADAVMVLPPSFVKPGPADLLDYYRRVADAAGRPLILQDAPQLTGVTMAPELWATMSREIPLLAAIKVEGTPQGATISDTRRLLAEGRQVAIFCGWGGLGILDALDRGAAGSMPAPNFTGLFVDIQMRYETGDPTGAEVAFGHELPFLVWSMQSIDHSVATAKEELRRRGIITSAHMRRPVVSLDQNARVQLNRFIDRRLDS